MVQRKPKDETKDKPGITDAEVQKYTEAIKGLPQYRFDGMLISPRERYCISLGALKIQNGEMIVIEPTIMRYVDELDKRRPRERYKPSKEWWDEIRDKVKVMQSRVVHAPEESEIPF